MPKGYFTDRRLWLQKKREASFRTRKKIDIELLKKRYVEDRISTHALQKEFGVTNNTIRKRLIESGITIRGCGNAQKLIPHDNPLIKMGYDKWYSVTHSPEAKRKRILAQTGKKHSESWKLHMRLGIGRGKENALYKKDAKYKAIHAWVCNNWSKKGMCQYCGATPKVTHWANLDWKYDRENKDTWLEMCQACNNRYDKNITFRHQLLNDLNIKSIVIPDENTKRPTY